jgi:hypothetical protein
MKAETACHPLLAWEIDVHPNKYTRKALSEEPIKIPRHIVS